VNAATDHERLGSSAFPNYANGAIDNYYSMAHSHVDNSPFAEGTASPADSGPIGQTAAAGNAQQPQYADARWPGDSNSGQATFGSQGGPYAAANASDYKATAESEEASSASGGSGGSSNTSMIVVPKGFDGRLRDALAAWKAKWLPRLGLAKPTITVRRPPAAPAVPTIPTPAPPAVTLPAVTVTTPVATVTTPSVPVGGVTTTPSVPVPPITVPTVTVPPVTGIKGAPVRTLSASSPSGGTSATTTSPTTTAATTTSTTTTSPTTTTTPSGGGPPPDGASLLASTTLASVDPTTGALVTSGESSLGRVSLGSGQIEVEGIHVSASITNTGTAQTDSFPGDTTTTGTTPTGTTTTDTTSTDTTTTDTTTTDTTSAPTGSPPTYTVSVRVASASIGGVPVTIDQDGVHVAGHDQALPYQQASDALNAALKQAGIQLFMVGPEINTTNGEETIDATGLHVVFTQPVSAPGAPTQFAEHILGEVYVDSLAVLGQPLPNLDLNSPGGPLAGGATTTKTGTKTKPKPKTKKLRATGGLSKRGRGSSAGGSTASGTFPSSSSGFGSPQPSSSSTGYASQPSSSSTGAPQTNASQSIPATVASALKKPWWLLIAYLVWQALAIAAGTTLWSWRRGEAT